MLLTTKETTKEIAIDRLILLEPNKNSKIAENLILLQFHSGNPLQLKGSFQELSKIIGGWSYYAIFNPKGIEIERKGVNEIVAKFNMGEKSFYREYQ